MTNLSSLPSHRSEAATIEVSTTERDGIAVLLVQGPLTINTIFKFQDAWRARQTADLVMDLSGVPYADSAAVGSIVNAYVSRKNAGRRFALVASDRVKMLMSMTKVDTLFPLCSTVEEALAAVKSA